VHGKGPWWRQQFQQYSVRVTAPREIVMDILQNTKEHLSASDIYIAANSVNPAIGLTTIYRTLDMLEQMNIVQKFDFGDGRARYELINNPVAKAHHHHMICMKCRKVIDYTEFVKDEIEFIEKTQAILSKKYNFNITDHNISFYGFCEKCNKEAYA
jgi:Fur family ferric uptake transcriptional regulator